MIMACEEKDRLLDEYNQAVTKWAQAVQGLSGAGTSQSAYLELLSRVDDARANTHRAKAAFTQHVAKHHC
jgi:hypothetical protein